MLSSLYTSALFSHFNKYSAPLDFRKHFKALTLLDLTHIGRKNLRKIQTQLNLLKSLCLSASLGFFAW